MNIFTIVELKMKFGTAWILDRLYLKTRRVKFM